MKIEKLLEELESSVKSTETITYSVSKAKGIVTVIASHHFPNVISCLRAYQNTTIDFEEVKSKFLYLQKKYKDLYIKTRLIDEKIAKHYDDVYNAGLNETIKNLGEQMNIQLLHLSPSSIH